MQIICPCRLRLTNLAVREYLFLMGGREREMVGELKPLQVAVDVPQCRGAFVFCDGEDIEIHF